MATIDTKSFNIDGSLELAADSFTAEQRSAERFLNGNDTESVKFSGGLRDRTTLVVSSVGQVVGKVDQFTLRKSHNSVTCSISGRDNMALLLDGRIKKQWLKNKPEVGKEPTVDYVYGSFTAKEIAKEIVEDVGLTLSWECRDYTLLTDFCVNGRRIDAIRKLIEPWLQVEPVKVDLFCHDNTILIRPRSLSMTADYTYSIHDARINDFTIQKKRGPIYGLVTLQGRLVNKPLYGGVYSSTTPVPPDSPTTAGQPLESWELELTKLSETKDEVGVVTRVTSVAKYRMPDKILLQTTETSFQRKGTVASAGLGMISQRIVYNEWEESIYNETKRINTPRQTGQRVVTSGIHKDDKSKVFQQLTEEVTTFGRDTDQYRDLTSIKFRELNLKSKALELSQYTVKFLKDKDNSQGVVEQTTIVYKPTKRRTVTGSSVTDEENLYVAAIDTQDAAGSRVEGPPSPGAPVKAENPYRLTPGANAPLEAIVYEEEITDLDVDSRAQDFEYSNRNLTLDDLKYLFAQLEATSGLWHYTIQLSGVSMPWLRKGNILYLTGLLDQAGASIPLAPALITNMNLRYDEGSAQPSMITSMTLEYWSAT